MFLVMGVAAALGSMYCKRGKVIGAMPVTGIPLPLMSYGGSARCCFPGDWPGDEVRLRRFVN